MRPSIVAACNAFKFEPPPETKIASFAGGIAPDDCAGIARAFVTAAVEAVLGAAEAETRRLVLMAALPGGDRREAACRLSQFVPTSRSFDPLWRLPLFKDEQGFCSSLKAPTAGKVAGRLEILRIWKPP